MRLTRIFVLFVCLTGLILTGRVQVQAQAPDPDSLFPSAHALVPDPNVKSPFKSIIVLHPIARGHKSTSTVDVTFTVGNQYPQTAALLFSTNPALSKAADDLDSLYSISQVRYGSNKQDTTMPPTTVELHPDQTLHCGIYINNVPLAARYIAKLVLLTSITVNQVSAGEDNIIFTNIPIDWK